MARALFPLASLFAIFALACSDPAAVPAQGALYISVGKGPVGDCSIGSDFSIPSGTEATIAIRDHGGEDPTTGEVYRVVDGDDKVDVSCSVSVDDSDNVTMQATLDKPQSVSFVTSGTFTSNGGEIFVGEWDNQTGNNLSDNACTVSPQVVVDGAIYGSFSCPTFGDGALIQCQASGTFIFENCEKK